MKKIYAALSHHKIYFAAILVVLFSAAVFLTMNGKEAAFVSLNGYHNFFMNVFFINYTFMGDGVFALCLAAVVFFYFKKKQTGFALLSSFLISGLAVQLIKNLDNSARPKLYFEAGTYIDFIDGVALSNQSGFPSGHTATAFAIATILVLMLKNRKMYLLFLPAAILIGYSRIYLAQHFLLDIMVGALLGTVSGIVSFYLVQSKVTLKKSLKQIYQSPSSSASSQGAMQTA